MRRTTLLFLVIAFAAAVVCGWLIAGADLGLAKTVLVGFGALATLVVAGLLAELTKRRRPSASSRRGSRVAHS